VINSLRFRNFKALRRVDLGLERLTLLVGPSGSGKTSVLDGLHHLTRLASAEPREVFTRAASVGLIGSRGASGAFELGLAGSFRARRGSLSIAFPAIEDFPFSSTYVLESRWGDRHRAIRRDLDADPGAAGALSPAELPLSPVLGEAVFLRFDPRRLAAPSPVTGDTARTLGTDGTNLAGVIADLATTRPDEFLRVEGALRAVIRGLHRVRVVRVGRADTLVFDMVGAADLPAHAMSEGTLRLLGLFTALIAASPSCLVLIDPLDLAVGPLAVTAFMRQINAILAADPRLQIAATTDSPQLLDEVTAEEVRIHALQDDGAALVVPLASHPDFALLHDDLRPGELWTATGDAWVAEASRVAARSTIPPPLPPSIPPPASPRAW
jgi:putative AbiEii toxin of type IV toxin-antitoxin system